MINPIGSLTMKAVKIRFPEGIMKKMIRRFRPAAAILIAIPILALSGAYAAAAPSSVTVDLRIEGISGNIYDGTVQVPYEDGLSAADVLAYADEQSAGLAITGIGTGFISDINGDSSGTFGGWDGWLFKVNGADPAVGIADCSISEGDHLLVYYGDPFGAGMQFPEADLSGLDDGVILFTSRDTTYDAQYNPTVTVNPVAGATVTWRTGDRTSTYTTDPAGRIVLTADDLTPGLHGMQIAKTGDIASGGRYLPLVLRFAPNDAVEVAAHGTPAPESTAGTDANPATDGPSGAALPAAGIVIAAMAFAAALRRQPAAE